MQLTDHSLQQLDEGYLEKLEEKALRALSAKLLVDLKEARERLNQNSRNSSKPPSSDNPWKKSDDTEEEEIVDADSESQSTESTQSDEGNAVVTTEKSSVSNQDAPPPQKRKAGKVAGAPGYGRAAPERVDFEQRHTPACCVGCQSTQFLGLRGYTGHHEIDWVVMPDGSRKVHAIKHIYEEGDCACGLSTRAEPARYDEDGIAMGGFHLVGPGLATLIVALSLRYRMSRGRIQEFLKDWLVVELSMGTIHNAIAEAGAAVAPVESGLISEIQNSQLLHADETPWPEQQSNMSLWLWVFVSHTTVLYVISHRGKELVRNLLEDYQGTVMSDGWQAYRWLSKRLRCWAHLKRKAVGLTQGFDADAKAFGSEVLAIWKRLQQDVKHARDQSQSSIRAQWESVLSDFRALCEKVYLSCKHKKTHELAGEYLNDWAAIFRILDNPSWPLTNNEAERTLRHWVIYRQITHGTRTERGSRGLALLASVIDTCRLRRCSPWDYLQTTISRRRQNLTVLPLPA